MRLVELCESECGGCCEDTCDPGPVTESDSVHFCYTLPQPISDFGSIEFSIRDYMSGATMFVRSGAEDGPKYTSDVWAAEPGYWVVKAKVTRGDGSTYHLNSKVVNVAPLQI